MARLDSCIADFEIHFDTVTIDLLTTGSIRCKVIRFDKAKWQTGVGNEKILAPLKRISYIIC